jgi:hypothetical protein
VGDHPLPEMLRLRVAELMGRWFPNLRKGTPEQVKAHDRAQRELNENSKRERKAGVRDETPEFVRLNHRVNEAAKPLSRFQQSRVARDERMAAEDRRAAREQRRTRRAGRAR